MQTRKMIPWWGVTGAQKFAFCNLTIRWRYFTEWSRDSVTESEQTVREHEECRSVFLGMTSSGHFAINLNLKIPLVK